MVDESSISLTRAQVREVDRRAIEEYGIPGVVLMENAGRGAAEIIARLVSGNPDVAQPPSAVIASTAIIAIACGPGNNGGDGFVIARHLHIHGLRVELFLCCDPAKLTGDAATNYRIVERMGLRCRSFAATDEIAAARPSLREARVIVDAILGTGFRGEVKPPLDAAIEAINAARPNTQAPALGSSSPLVVAIDVPSGLDCDTGLPCKATVRADYTISFVGRKAGFAAPGAGEFTGLIHVADIGAPREIIEAVLSRC